MMIRAAIELSRSSIPNSLKSFLFIDDRSAGYFAGLHPLQATVDILLPTDFAKATTIFSQVPALAPMT